MVVSHEPFSVKCWVTLFKKSFRTKQSTATRTRIGKYAKCETVHGVHNQTARTNARSRPTWVGESNKACKSRGTTFNLSKIPQKRYGGTVAQGQRRTNKGNKRSNQSIRRKQYLRSSRGYWCCTPRDSSTRNRRTQGKDGTQTLLN